MGDKSEKVCGLPDLALMLAKIAAGAGLAVLGLLCYAFVRPRSRP